MPFTSGTFSLYTPGNPVITGTTISSTWANNTLSDIASNGLSFAILKDGSQTITGNIPFSGFRLTGLGAGTAATDALQYQQGVNSGLPCQGRLTLTSGTPVTTGDVTAAGTLYFTPYKGNTVSTYSGTAWTTQVFTQKSLALTLTSGKPYDIFIVDSTLALESLVWTDDTTRATALAYQDGVLVKSGAATRRYLGTIYSSGVNTTEDSVAKRYVWNYYNRVVRPMRVLEATDTWTYTTATIRQANGSTANQLDFVNGYNEDMVSADVTASVSNTAAGAFVSVYVGLDSTTTAATGAMSASPATQSANNVIASNATWKGFTGVGRHVLTWLEYSTNTGTTTWIGDNGVPTRFQAGIHGELLA